MSINKTNGKLEGETKVSELIEYLNEHLEYYGDTDVIFEVQGERDMTVNFDHYKDAIVISLEEEEDCC